MSITDALPLLAIAAFVWAEIWGTEEQQKVAVVGVFVMCVVWVLTSSE